MPLTLSSFISADRLSNPVVSPCGSYVVACLARLNKVGDKRVSELWRFPIDGEESSEAESSKPECLEANDEGASQPRFDNQGVLYFLSKRVTPTDGSKKISQVWRKQNNANAEPITDEPLGVEDFRLGGTTLVVLAGRLPGIDETEQRKLHREHEQHGASGRMYRNFPVRSWDHWTGGPALHLIAHGLNDKSRLNLTPDFEYQLASYRGLTWDVSDDGSALVTEFLRPGPNRMEDGGLLCIDLRSSAQMQVGCEPGVTHDSLRISPDGSRIAAVRHTREPESYGKLKVCVYQRTTGAMTVLADCWDWSPSLQSWHGDNALLITTPMSGDMPVYRVCLESEQVTRITSEEVGGSHSNIQCIGNFAIGLRSTLASPPEIFRVQLEANQVPTSITSLFDQIEIGAFHVERQHCIGAGQTQIDYFMLTPAGDVKPRPTLLWIHGGPVSSWLDGWHWRWNPLPFLDAGYNIALPNPRGSTGYGQVFIDDIVNNRWGGDCYQDLMAVTDHLCAREDVDSQRVVAMGGSFGGYMSNWIGTQTERFAAIVTHASLYRLSAFQGTTDYPSYWADSMGLYPSDNIEEYEKYSPHRHVDNWKTPTLITHGEKDYRVPISEGLMLFEDLHRREIDVELLIFPDENHWINKPRNSLQWYSECLRFIAAHV